MYYVIFNSFDVPVAVETSYFDAAALGFAGNKPYTTQSRNDWKTFEQARDVAERLTTFAPKVNGAVSGRFWLPVDNGEGCYPRYDICQAPKVGDKVSYGMNGDCYPDGQIVKVSPTFVVTTSSGNKYRRKKLTSNWLQTGGSWCLVQGHHYAQNPSF